MKTMDDPNSSLSSLDSKNYLPDVVNPQLKPTFDVDLSAPTGSKENKKPKDDNSVADSEMESISEHLPSNQEYSLSKSEIAPNNELLDSLDLQSTNMQPEVVRNTIISQTNELNAPVLSLDSGSWNIDTKQESQLIANISPELIESSDPSKEQRDHQIEPDSLKDTPRHDYPDSLNDPSNKSLSHHTEVSFDKDSISIGGNKKSSNSEEIIKLDIRGTAIPNISEEKIIFGPPPDGSQFIERTDLPIFVNLMPPLLIAGNSVDDLVFDTPEQRTKEPSPEKSVGSCSDKSLEKDLLVEEFIVDETFEASPLDVGCETNRDNPPEAELETDRTTIPPKSLAPDSLTATEYKNISEEFQSKLEHFETAITERDDQIRDLTHSLQRLELENGYLTKEVLNLQHIVGESELSHDNNDNVKTQISDFMQYEKLVDDTKFYSAIASGSSLHSSNGEKDMDNEEMTVNFSKSDVDISNDFVTGFEDKLNDTLAVLTQALDENLINNVKEKLMKIYCEEIGKIRLESDTEIKEIEVQMTQDKNNYKKETHRLENLLLSVKAGSCNIEELRVEMEKKHEKEMGSLREYFEKKCSELERSYSEMWRGRSLSSEPEDQMEPDAAGDAPRPRPIPAQPHSDQYHHQLREKYSLMIEQLKSDHLTHVNGIHSRHKEDVERLNAQISELKARIQTLENTEPNTEYHQDIDSELEKVVAARVEQAKRDMLDEIQEQMKVLLSEPDAELSSWPLELVALRDRLQIEVTKKQQEKEISSVDSGEDKWKQRRNHSFDQNRHLKEVTKERDNFKQVAVSLQRVVSHLVSYCSAAEDEINKTVLSELLTPLVRDSVETSTALSPRRSEPRHVHFAPSLARLEGEEGLLEYLRGQGDLSKDIKHDLEVCLQRLKEEAHGLLELSARLGARNNLMLETSEVQIKEIIDEQQDCDNCEMFKKNMKEIMSECGQRENVLKSELDAAMMKISELTTHDDVVVEGYGVHSPLSLLSRPPPPRSPLSPLSPHSPRSPRDALTLLVDRLHRDNEDLTQQLESANRQLRSSRQFIEQQAVEREVERDEYNRQIRDLADENSRLSTKLQNNASILNEVEQLEQQTREMNEIISDLEDKRTYLHNELKTSDEKITLLREIISNLELKLDQKTTNEENTLKELEEMKNTIEDRDSKLRALVGELELLRSERDGTTSVSVCEKCAGDEKDEFVDKIKEEISFIECVLSRRISILESIHEVCSGSCSEHTEDVSIREQRNINLGVSSPNSPRADLTIPWVLSLEETVRSLIRTEDAMQKRVHDLQMMRDQLAHVAQEVRAERDVLQSRLSEQALTISSLGSRLDQQRQSADAKAHSAVADLTVQLHDVTAQVQRLKEELDSKDKQLSRLKQSVDDRAELAEMRDSLYGNTCNPKDKVIILERELSRCQSRIAALEIRLQLVEDEKVDLHRLLEDKDRQLQDILALKLEEEENEQKSEIDPSKSARTLSDIVSISDFDEQDLQMRRLELRNQNISVQNQPHKEVNNMTLPPDIERPNMSSLHIEHTDYFDIHNSSPKADSLPNHLTSTRNKDVNFKRNVNETTMFGSKIRDNCSMHPNKDVSEKNVSIGPKVLNFSIEPSKENQEFLKELGISLEMNQDNFPDILSQLKEEITKSRKELKEAEEQLSEFPALKDEVENLKNLLENTISTMNNDKQYYEKQLDSFTTNKTSFEEKITELTKQLTDKSQDLTLLKEDILRRENMILELAKERRNLTNKIQELETTIDELQSRNNALEKYELENRELRNKITESTKLEQLVTEKNQQIDSLNQHLDRLDDLQRKLNDKSEEYENLKDAFEEKSNEVYQLQDTIDALNKDLTSLHEENNNLNSNNNELKLKLTKLEKEQENQSLKIQNNESELQRVNSINSELSSKIDELKQLNEQLKDKETEIELLNEDINAFHEEIASLKSQLSSVSRSPSPRKESKERQALNDTKQLVKIRKQVTLLQHELDFNKKELNDKAFELARAQLDLSETKNALSSALNRCDETQLELRQVTSQIEALQTEKTQLEQKMAVVLDRLREESSLEELKQKLRYKSEQCDVLERKVGELRAALHGEAHNMAVVRSSTRSPTLELERALHDQINYSHQLDDTIMEQILSASSDNDDIPRLALNSSKSSSVVSSHSERVYRLQSEIDKLRLQADTLTARLQDKDALITELIRVRDKLLQECESLTLKFEAERDSATRLQLLLDNFKDNADTLQKQDSNMIVMLKKRLESAMRAELQVQHDSLNRKELNTGDEQHEAISRLESELSILRSRMELERSKCSELSTAMEQLKESHVKELNNKKEHINGLRTELAELRRLKHEAGIELLRAKELLNIQSDTIKQLESKLEQNHRLTYRDTTEVVQTNQNTDLIREIATLKRCVLETTASERTELITQLKMERNNLTEKVHRLEQELKTSSTEDKELAIRYLNGRVLRLESCRKALVWQKRYLQRVVAGYKELEVRLSLPTSSTVGVGGSRRFRCAVSAVIAVIRMRFLVQRRIQIRHFTSAAILPRTNRDLHVQVHSSPLSRSRTTDCMARRHQTQHNVSPRKDTAAAYLNKLELVSRCINEARYSEMN